jgi:hypothetical protein
VDATKAKGLAAVSRYSLALMALYLQGLATDDDVLRELYKPDNTGVKLRAKDQLWKNLGY